MKQRVVVQAIVRTNGRTLLLRRCQGRPGIVGKYELPGGSLADDEQPDDALRRHLKNDVGLTVGELRLSDVVLINNREEGDIQHIFIVYLVDGVSPGQGTILGPSYDKYSWLEKSEIQQTELRDSAWSLLELYNPSVNGEVEIAKAVRNEVNNTTNKTRAIIYSDGGSRGNPGPSAAAYVIMDEQSNVLGQGGAYLGITTNNQTEYHGVQLGLERALELGFKAVDFRLDSLLVVNQMKGLYKIKNRELWPINERITDLITKFDRVRFTHVPRESNQLADGLVNKFLDEHQKEPA